MPQETKEAVMIISTSIVGRERQMRFADIIQVGSFLKDYMCYNLIIVY